MKLEISKQVSLAKYTSWQVGGPADFFCEPTTIAEVEEALRFASSKKIPWTVLGGGTNVLISDLGLSGLVIDLQKLTGHEIFEGDGTLSIECLAGTGKSELLKIFLKHKLPPALFMAGLPGDVGGGIVMNAGVAENFVPREFGELIEWIEVLKMDGPHPLLKRISHDEIKWSYRHSEGWKPGVIVKARLTWVGPQDLDILQKVRDANRVRSSKQPLDLPSCGSVFVNPEGKKAAQLIDGCGLKGLRVGGAEVSTKHANFIVNTGGATAEDIRSLIRQVQAQVQKSASVSLKTEVVMLGEFRQT